MTEKESLLMLVVVLLIVSVMSIGLLLIKTKQALLARLSKSGRMQLLGAKTARTFGRYGSLASSDSEALQKVKKSKMHRGAIKDLLYGGLVELMRNRQYYYRSSAGVGYSHWTEEGKEALEEYMNMICDKVLQTESAEDDARAKELVLRELKGK